MLPIQNPFIWPLPEIIDTAMRDLARAKSYKKGDVVQTMGVHADGVFRILSGWVKMSRISNSAQLFNVGMLYPSSWFGDVATITNTEAQDNYIAGCDLELEFVSKSDFLAFLKTRPDVQEAMLFTQTSRLATMVQLLGMLRLGNLSIRLAWSLIFLNEVHMRHFTKDKYLPISQQMLADMQSVTRDNVGRILRQWGDEGLIELGREKIAVLDIDSLQARAFDGLMDQN